MPGTTPSSLGFSRPVEGGHDLGWYGSLALIVACIGLLAAAGFVG